MKDIPLELYTMEKINSFWSEVIYNGSASNKGFLDSKILKVISIFRPFLHYYFPYYKTSQKLVILRLMSNFSVYDEKLFANFVDHVSVGLE